MFISAFLRLKAHHSGSVECQPAALIWCRGLESDCSSREHPYQHFCFPINIFRINELIGEYKRAIALSNLWLKEFPFLEFRKEKKLGVYQYCRHCLGKNMSWRPQTPGALAGTLCVGVSLSYHSSRALVIDHRLCPSHLDFLPDKPPAACNAVSYKEFPWERDYAGQKSKIWLLFKYTWGCYYYCNLILFLIIRGD